MQLVSNHISILLPAMFLVRYEATPWPALSWLDFGFNYFGYEAALNNDPFFHPASLLSQQYYLESLHVCKNTVRTRLNVNTTKKSGFTSRKKAVLPRFFKSLTQIKESRLLVYMMRNQVSAKSPQYLHYLSAYQRSDWWTPVICFCAVTKTSHEFY